MLIRLHEGVLHGFVGFRRVAQIVVRDPSCAPLVPRDELGIAFARGGLVAGRLQRFDR